LVIKIRKVNIVFINNMLDHHKSIASI
jgi:hypothetical protein